MDQFLLSYWWLIVLITIVVAVIGRSVIRIAVILASLALIFIVFWGVIIAPGMAKSNQCFEDASKATSSAYKLTEMMVPGVERSQRICMEDESGFRTLVDCLSASKRSNWLSFTVYSILPKFRETINTAVTTHNDLCPENLINMPSF